MSSPIFLGPRTLSWRAIAGVTIASVLATAASNPQATPIQRMEWIGAGVLAMAPLIVVYAASTWLGMARRRLGVLAAVVVGSLARAAALAALVSTSDAGDPLSFTDRVISATVTFIGWGVIIGAALQASMDYRADLRSLLSRVDRTVDEAEEFARAWNRRLASSPTSARGLAHDAADLQSDITARLRPLSHRLWFGMTSRESQRRLLRQMGEDRPPIVSIAAIGFLVFLWNAAYRFGIAEGVLSSLVVTSAPVLTLIVANTLAVRDPRRQVMWRWLSYFVAPITSGLAAFAYFGFYELVPTTIVILADLAIILASQTTAVSLRRRRQVLSELRERVDELDHERATVASHLHSTVQSRWSAAALQFQLAAESGDDEQARRALAETREILASMSTRPTESQGLEAIAEAWEGIAVVNLDLEPNIPAGAAATVGQIVDEAVANAVRHGRAKHVSVLVRLVGSDVEVVVSDDGTGVAADAIPGLGSAWRDEVSTWELVNVNRGARLTARIPLSGG